MDLDGKSLGPQAFLPSVEQTALIHPLTDWVAAEALRQLREWGPAADGIEDAATIERLTDLGADVGQGYYIARPMRPTAVEEWRLEHERPKIRLTS